MRENSIEPDLPIMSALVSAFGAANNIDGVRSATHSALKLENVDGRLFVDIICAFTTCGAYQEALDIFHSSKCPKNIQTCTATMQAYIDSGKVKDAERIYNKMRINKSEGGYGFLPNARAHTTMLNGYEKSLMSSSAVNLQMKSIIM
jgi:pentatricopeptide repeat protein